MAIISKTVCDRCGKEIKYLGWTSKIFRVRKIFNGNPSGYDYSDCTWELCNECTKGLKEFMKGAKGDSE